MTEELLIMFICGLIIGWFFKEGYEEMKKKRNS